LDNTIIVMIGLQVVVIVGVKGNLRNLIIQW